jgi:hypothetical protein
MARSSGHDRVLGGSSVALATALERGMAFKGRCSYDHHAMCRNIRVLYNFDPPTTQEEVRAAARQYVRKVSGLSKPSGADAPVFEAGVAEVAAATRRLLGSLRARTIVRTREREREKAKARGERRARGAPV